MEAVLDAFPEYRHALLIWKVISPLLILVGVSGNILTIVVLMQRRSRSSSTALYLTALAISDLCVLCTGLMRQWLRYLVDIDIRYLTSAGCQIHVFIVYVGTQCSSWMLVAVTIERFIGVWAPHRVKQGCHSRSAAVVVIVVIICISLLNMHWFIGLGEVSTLKENSTEVEVNICTPLYEAYGQFLSFTWPWVDLCIFCLVPFTILVVGNISILVKVLVSRRKTRTQINPVQPSVPSVATSSGHTPMANNNVRLIRKDDKTSQLAVTLLLLNVVFLVCVTPISIYLIGEPHWYAAMETLHDVAVIQLWWAVVNMFMYLNHTLNFVLYFLSGSRFRAEVKALLFGRPGTERGIFPTIITRVAPAAAPSQGQSTILSATGNKSFQSYNEIGRPKSSPVEHHELQQY